MNNRQIEESIKQSIALDTPDLFDKIVSAPVQKLPEEDYIVKEHCIFDLFWTHTQLLLC